jgi:hypothetical protein
MPRPTPVGPSHHIPIRPVHIKQGHSPGFPTNPPGGGQQQGINTNNVGQGNPPLSAPLHSGIQRHNPPSRPRKPPKPAQPTRHHPQRIHPLTLSAQPTPPPAPPIQAPRPHLKPADCSPAKPKPSTKTPGEAEAEPTVPSRWRSRAASPRATAKPSIPESSATAKPRMSCSSALPPTPIYSRTHVRWWRVKGGSLRPSSAGGRAAPLTRRRRT